MSEKTTKREDGEGDVVAVPSGYVPGRDELDLPAGQNVGDRGEVIPSPEDVLEQERVAVSEQTGGSGSPNSPDTAAAGSEHKDR